MFQATLFQTLPLQQTDAQVPSAPGQQSSQVVTDVIQQLLELSEPGPVEASQPPQAAQQLSITVGINQDILQVRRAAPAVRVCQGQGHRWGQCSGLIEVETFSPKMCPN